MKKSFCPPLAGLISSLRGLFAPLYPVHSNEYALDDEERELNKKDDEAKEALLAIATKRLQTSKTVLTLFDKSIASPGWVSNPAVDCLLRSRSTKEASKRAADWSFVTSDVYREKRRRTGDSL